MNNKGFRKLLIYKSQIGKLAVKELINTKFYAMVLISVILAGMFNLSPVISSLMSNVTIRSSGTISTISPLHVEGRYIKDVFNNTIVLKGVNQAGMLDDPNGWWNPEGAMGYHAGLGIWNPDAVKYNLDKMKEWGANHLRLLIRVSWWMDNTKNYRQHIKDILMWAGERGLYVVFCPYMVVTGDSAFKPPWESTNPEDLANIPDSQAFMDFWANVADELKRYPNVIFEVYNEAWMGDAETQQWIDTVRATGADQLLIVQYYSSMGVNFWWSPDEPYGPLEWAKGMEWVEEKPLINPLGNIVYSFHLYRGGIHKYTGDPLERTDVYTYDDLKYGFQLAKVDYVVNELNKPIYVGEIGANMWHSGEALEEELSFFANCLTIFNEWELSYSAWVWTVTVHMRHGLLQTVMPWLPPPTPSGEILISKIAEG